MVDMRAMPFQIDYHASSDALSARLTGAKGSIDITLGYWQAIGAEVVRLHTAAEYTVCFFGFMPGFSYWSGLPDVLAVPRLAVPRVKVPAGSVGIGGTQTGIYPLETPGGWRIVGRTPLRLFNPRSKRLCFLQLGDRVRLVPIPLKEFKRQEGAWGH